MACPPRDSSTTRCYSPPKEDDSGSLVPYFQTKNNIPEGLIGGGVLYSEEVATSFDHAADDLNAEVAADGLEGSIVGAA